MELKNVPYPLVQLPSRTELLLYLIKEELKNRRFFDTLQSIGVYASDFQSDLGTLIISYAGLDTEEDAINDFYYHLIGLHGCQIQKDNASVMHHALLVYTELMAEKKRRDGK